LVKRVNPESYFTRETNDFSDYIEDLAKSFYFPQNDLIFGSIPPGSY
jgi:hypothetical protein